MPRNNVLLVGLLWFWPESSACNHQLGAELLNFGAFIGFIMGANALAFTRYWLRSDDRRWFEAVSPILGFAVCFYIWWSLRTPARVMGYPPGSRWDSCSGTCGSVEGN